MPNSIAFVPDSFNDARLLLEKDLLGLETVVCVGVKVVPVEDATEATQFRAVIGSPRPDLAGLQVNAFLNESDAWKEKDIGVTIFYGRTQS